MSQLRVYLVDDHPVVRNGLKALIADEAGMEVVGEAADGETAVREVVEVRPDVVVMDLSMPGMGGTEAAVQIHKGCPEVRVVALTAHEDRAYVRRVLAAGASGYVLKRTAAADLIGAIRHAAAGNTYLDPAVAGHLVPGVDEAAVGRPDLSEREIEVLRQIAQGYSNKQISVRLNISVKTVETYKARAMEKLGTKSRVDVVKYAVEQGWLPGG
ncbi:MAG TPA: response regulator transcription factor [Urbifossiella sp.]|nr:response regulator transcription factor [Urbifossiella sp.]